MNPRVLIPAACLSVSLGLALYGLEVDDVMNGDCSSHFEIHELCEGVYAALHKDGGGAICNSGIVDLGDRTLIFDAFLTPQAALDLKTTAEALTGKPVSIVINSHCHNDHIWGNQVFGPGANIISTVITRASIAAKGLEECTWYKENAPKRLASLQERYEAASDEKERSELSSWLDYYRHLVEATPTLEVVLPSVTFSGRMVIHGSRRTAELIEYKNGHTRSDIILFLPDEKVIFMGDLLFVNSHPYLGDGDPDSLIRILQEIKRMDAKTLVSGHGRIGMNDDLEVMINYVEACRELAGKMVNTGKKLEAIEKIEVPGAFEAWQQEGFFRTNLRFFYGRLLKTQQD